MSSLQELKEGLWETAPSTIHVRVHRPRPIPEGDDSLEFHAARLLLLLRHAPGKVKKIEGRTKLAKLDFLIRYPTYLLESAKIKGVETDLKASIRPESTMIRYKYGPWDARYYDILAYMVAKGLIDVEPNRSKGDVFRLTEKGSVAAGELEGPEFQELHDRCELAQELFGHLSGSTVKDFIYQHFTEVVNRPIGSEIEVEDVS